MPRHRLALGRVGAALLLALAVALPAAAETPTASTKLLRFPDIHGDKVVFCYGGDLWTAPSTGGTAVRLTAHPGLELFPKFSPDGKWIAFTGQYDGDEQVYVIPSTGGVPRQLTFYPAWGPLPARWGYDNQVYGWTNDGKAVLFRSLRDGWELTLSRLYTVPLDGGQEEPLPMPVSGAGDFSPDGTKVVYSPLVRDFRTWKRYEGGWAQDLYIFDLASHAQENITSNPRTDRDPMWIGGKIYFASDRDGHLNLYSYDPASKATAELTHETKYDVRWPSKGEAGEIVYELNGELRVFDTRTGQSRAIPITVPDDGLNTRPSRVSASDQIEGFGLSPKGERALFWARGDVFTAPIEKGNTRDLTRTPGAHEKWAAWSPDGSRIAYISDQSGEEEIWVTAQDGDSSAQQLTSGGQAMRYRPLWSPDGKRIAFSDKDGKLWVLTVLDKKLESIAQDGTGNLFDYTWSPDSAYLAFSVSHPNGLRSLVVWSAADGKSHDVSREPFNSYAPAWDPSGEHLYYLADREFAPLISQLEFNYAVDRPTSILALTLRQDGKSPFPPQSDEVEIKKAESAKGEAAAKDEKKDGKKEEKKPEAPKPVKIDWTGLADRVTRVPLEADNYFGLNVTKDGLVYMTSGGFFYGREVERKPVLHFYAFKDRKESDIASEVDDFALSADGAKVLVQQKRAYNLYEVKAGGGEKKSVATAGLVVDRVPREEWREVFDEVWRRYRDFFYVKNMHGYDWAGLRDQYKALLPYVAHRSDLNYVLGEMVAELDVSHAYIVGGDWYQPERPKVALPGARFALDKASGRYRIAEIFRGENDEERYRAPLTEVGVAAKEGDYVLAIDGVDLPANENPYRLLRGKLGGTVELLLNDKPSREGARKVTFKPIGEEHSLLYDAWVRHNREKVAALSGGKLGYLHIPDMGDDGIREFIKWFYPQIRKQGLVVDARYNGGGNVSQMLIERLQRKLLSVDFSRNVQWPGTYPSAVFVGPMAALINETTASDGDIFGAMFKQAKLGKVYGKRSWGGVVGISGHGPLIDGGQVFVPEGATASTDGRYIIENHGVDPDVVVENEAKDVLEGKDPQLERAVADLLQEIAAHPQGLPQRPADPVKTP